MKATAPRSFPEFQINDGKIDDELDDLPARHFRSRYLCFLRDGPDGPDTEYEIRKVTDWIEQHADYDGTDFVFISSTRRQFLIGAKSKRKDKPEIDEAMRTAYCRQEDEDHARVLEYGMEAARSAKKRAFWTDFECIRDADNVARENAQSDDVYRICDIVRAAHSLVILLGPPRDTRVPGERHQHNYSPAVMDQWL